MDKRVQLASSKPVTTLECGSRWVEGIISIPRLDLLVCGSQDSKIRVYSPDPNDGLPLRVFSQHKGSVKGLVHLVDDVCASVDWKGTLYTWRVSTLEVIGELKASKDGCTSMIKVNDGELALGTREGEIVFVSHNAGHQLAHRAKISYREFESTFIREIAAANGLIVSVGMSNTFVSRCDHVQDKLLYSFRDEECATCVAINSKYLVTGGNDEKLYVRDATAAGEFPLLSKIDLNNFAASDSDIWIIHLVFLNDDTIMVTSQENGVYFVDLPSEKCLAYFLPANSGELNTAAVVSDGRIGYGGKNGYCALFNPPIAVRPQITAYTQRGQAPEKSVTNPRAKSLKDPVPTESVGDDVDAELMELLVVVEMQEKAIQEMRGKMETLETVVTDLKSRSLSTNTKMEQFRLDVKNLETNLTPGKENDTRERALKQVADVGVRLEAQEEKISVVRKDLAGEFEKKINAFKVETEAELAALNEVMQSMETEINESIKRDLQSSLKAQEVKSASMKKEMEVSWAASHQDLIKKTESTKKRVEDAEAEFKAQDTRLKAMEKRWQEHSQSNEEKIELLQHRLEESKVKAREEQLRGIKDEKLKSELVSQDERMKSMAETAEKRFSDLKKSVDEKLGDIKSLREQVESLELKLSDYSAKKIQGEKSALSAVEQHVQELKKEVSQDADKKLECVKAEIVQVKKKQEDNENKSADMLSEISALKKKSTSPQAPIVVAASEAKKDSEPNRHTNNNNLLEEKIRAQAEQYEELERSHKCAEDKLVQLECLEEKRAKETKDMQAKMATQEKELKLLKSELAELTMKAEAKTENAIENREVRLTAVEDTNKKEAQKAPSKKSWFSSLFCFSKSGR